MRNIVFILSSLIIALGCSSSKKLNSPADTETEVFLKQILLDSAGNNYLIRKSAYADCGIYQNEFLSTAEVQYAKKLMINENKWKTSPLPNIKVLPDKKFYKIDKDEFLKEKQNYVYIISKPIFLREHKYCIFYYKSFWGNLGGRDLLALYEKENGNWKVVKKFCNGIN